MKEEYSCVPFSDSSECEMRNEMVEHGVSLEGLVQQITTDRWLKATGVDFLTVLEAKSLKVVGRAPGKGPSRTLWLLGPCSVCSCITDLCLHRHVASPLCTSVCPQILLSFLLERCQFFSDLFLLIQLTVILKINFTLWNSFRFIEKIQRWYREFPYTHSRFLLLITSYMTVVHLLELTNQY